MSKTKMEIRCYNFEVRAEKSDAGNVITGRPIVYSSRTDLGAFDEIIEPGALDGTDLSDVRFLVNHDLSKIPLARHREGDKSSTMQIKADKDGLQIKVTLDTESNAEARALYSAIKRGDLTGMSFMFSIDDEEWEDEDSKHPTRHIKKISEVVEVSAVTFPAYEETELDARSVVKLSSHAKAKSAEPESDLELIKEKFKFKRRF